MDAVMYFTCEWRTPSGVHKRVTQSDTRSKSDELQLDISITVAHML
jgi:hypothetical protein